MFSIQWENSDQQADVTITSPSGKSYNKDNMPQANIVCIDYDAGATRINQENRIKLMLANARIAARKEGAAAPSRPAEKAEKARETV